MKIKSFDKANLKLVRSALNSALERVEEELGIELSIGNITYDRNGTGFRTKLEGAVISEDGLAMTQDARNFLTYAPLDGIPKEALNQSFVHDGKPYRLVGYRPRSKKYPYLCENGGDTFKFPTSLVKIGLGTLNMELS